MSENLFGCRCGFKCVESQLAKSDGYCPVCGEGRPDLVARHDRSKLLRRVQ